MKQGNIPDFFNRVVDRVGDKADAALVVVKKGEEISVHMSGIGELMVDPNAVAIAAALRHLLDTDMRTADRIGTKRLETGCSRITRQRMEVIDTRQKDEDKNEPPTDANEYGRMLAKALGEFLDVLKDGLEEASREE